MKSIILSILLVLVFGSQSHSGCVFVEKRDKQLFKEKDSPIGLVYSCTADSLNTITDFTLPNMSGQLQAIDEIIPGSNGPTSVTPTIKSIDGLTVYPGTATTTLLNGRQKMDSPEPFSNGITVHQDIQGASGCVWTLVMIFI